MNEKYQELKQRINKHCPYLYDGPKQLIRFDHTTEAVEAWKPIHLEDVLSAIDEQEPRKKFFYVSQNGAISYEKDVATASGCDYNLTKPLSEQSEETLDFLLGVIK